MIKLNRTNHRFMIAPEFPQADLQSGTRFLVPIPYSEADLTAVARRVWLLASTSGADVLFVGLCDEGMHEPALRRSLATRSAMANHGNVSAESEIVLGRNWTEVIRSCAQPGEMVVCWHDQNAGLLPAKLNVPIYFLSGLSSRKEPRSNRLAEAAAWIGSLAIALGFFFVQVKIDRFARDWTTVLLLISLVAELGAIWVWNSLFG